MAESNVTFASTRDSVVHRVAERTRIPTPRRDNVVGFPASKLFVQALDRGSYLLRAASERGRRSESDYLE